MKAITLLYHDVIPDDDYDYSGFSSPSANLYKFKKEEFKVHLKAIARNNKELSAVRVIESEVNGEKSLMLTFDDGGKCAHSLIADMLDEFNWKAHFFITTDFIGDHRFVNKEQIIDLHKRGHLIGSHSASHPAVMSSLNYKRIKHEWTKSKECLEDILGEHVLTASIPGGFYSYDVARAASDSKLKYLFTSEPVQSIKKTGNCLVIGRYTIFRRMPAEKAGELSCGRNSACFGQWFYWNLKKAAKKSGGKYYFKFRNFVADNKH